MRKLVIESEYIVWAYVSEVGSIKLKKHEDPWNSDYATIIVNEILKGSLKSDTLKVYFTDGMICPAPGTFFQGEEVLAFLDKRKKMDGFEVHALSYGVRHGLTKQDLATFRDRIQEIQEMLQTGENECNECVVGWLVKCALEKCTRWDGVYELSPQSDFMSYYDRDTVVQRGVFLNPMQKTKLFDALLAVDTLDYSDIALADIVMGINDSLLLDFLKSRLTRVDEKFFWPAVDIMQRIVYLTGNDELRDLTKKFETAYYDYSSNGAEEKRKIFLNFVDKMKPVKLKQAFVAQGKSSV